jgi:hypothetical protein
MNNLNVINYILLDTFEHINDNIIQLVCVHINMITNMSTYYIPIS